MNKILTGALLALLFISCEGSRNKELALKEKELELKEKELNLEISKLRKVESVPASTVHQIKEGMVAAEGLQKPNDPALSNINNLLGYWMDHENDNIVMYFDKDGTFFFKDFNRSKGKYEELTGTYTLNSGRLTLMYDDRARQNFRFIKEISTMPVYYIQKGRYVMVKATKE